MLYRAVNFLLIVCIICFDYCLANAQSWRRFSPPDKRLVIELPAPPKTLTREEERLPTIFPGSGVANFYSVDLIPGGEHEVFFGVVNLSKRLNDRRFDHTVNSNMLWIAGDDKHFSKQVDRNVGGLHGREFVFTKGDLSGRALFLNGGNRVYLLVYFTERETVSTEIVDRIFDSFRPLRIR